MGATGQGGGAAAAERAVRALEADLRRRDEELRLALRAGRMGTWHWDAVRGALRWDAPLQELYGLVPGTFGGTYRAWMALLHPDDRAAVRSTIEAALAAGGEGYESTVRAVWADGSVHRLEAHGRILRADDGTFSGTIGVVRDVTARQAAEEERERLLAAAERSAGSLSRLAEASLALTETLSIEGLQGRITTAAREVVGCAWAEVVLDGTGGVGGGGSGTRAAPGGDQLVVPLVGPDGATLGVVRCAGARDGRFGPEDRAVLVQLAQLASAAVQNARLFARVTEVARGLQASLLPPTLPDIPGVELGARYLAAGAGADVGGDFYDAIPVGPGRWLLAVGDVRGKGVAAAAVTGLARHTLRSAAAVEGRPRRLIAHLNDVLHRSPELTPHELDDPLHCTVAVVAVEPVPDGVRATVASGGHPLPLVARAGGRVEPIGCAGTLVGLLPRVEVSDVTTVLGPGDRLVLYTDGISERRDGHRFLGEEGIAEVLLATAGADAEATAGAVEARARAFAAHPPTDDMAVLVLRATDHPVDRPQPVEPT